MVDAAPHAVMLCNLLRHGLEQWAARGSSPAEAAALAASLVTPAREADMAGRAAALTGAASALGDAEDAVLRLRDHVGFIAKT